MPKQATVFYSWQSDLPHQTNHGFIEVALRQALKELHENGEFETEHVVDRDTRGAPGSPDIAATIFKKIDDSSVFVADVSIIVSSSSGRPCPNPNVLIELGYALKSLSSANLILVYNTAFGSITDLPFDLKGKRIVSYSLTPDEEPAADHQRRSKAWQRNTNFATDLVSTLIRVQVFGNEVKERSFNPWLDEIPNIFGNVSVWLRENSHRSAAIELELSENMESLAFTLDDVRDHVHVAGGASKFSAKVMAAVQAAADLQARIMCKGDLTEEARSEIVSVIVDQHKQIAGWVRRSTGQDLYRSGLYDDFLSAIVEAGYQLAQLSYYPLEGLEGHSAQALREIGESLHLIRLRDRLNSRRGGGYREAIVDFVAEKEPQLRSLILDSGFGD